MDNNELKIKFSEVTKQIDEAKARGEVPSQLLREKMELLQIGYKKLSESLQEDKFERNPKKYSTLLSYLNNIKEVQKEISDVIDNLPEELTRYI